MKEWAQINNLFILQDHLRQIDDQQREMLTQVKGNIQMMERDRHDLVEQFKKVPLKNSDPLAARGSCVALKARHTRPSGCQGRY